MDCVGYNPVLCPSSLVNEYYAFAVTTESLDGAPFVRVNSFEVNTNVFGLQGLAIDIRLTYLSRSECIGACAVQYLALYRNVLSVTTSETRRMNKLLKIQSA